MSGVPRAGVFQRQAHIPRFGAIVSSVAHRPKEACCVCPADAVSIDNDAVEP